MTASIAAEDASFCFKAATSTSAAARAATVSALRSLSEAIATLRDNDLKALEVAHCRALTAEEPTVKEVKDMVDVVSSQDVELALTDATASASGKRKVLQNEKVL